jgi:hypothetical protein
MFYEKVQAYRASRGESPYVNTIASTKKLFNKALRKDGANADKLKRDFYGERIRSVRDYRAWLRQQVEWNRQHLGQDAPKIRGVRSTQVHDSTL